MQAEGRAVWDVSENRGHKAALTSTRHLCGARGSGGWLKCAFLTPCTFLCRCCISSITKSHHPLGLSLVSLPSVPSFLKYSAPGCLRKLLNSASLLSLFWCLSATAASFLPPADTFFGAPSMLLSHHLLSHPGFPGAILDFPPLSPLLSSPIAFMPHGALDYIRALSPISLTQVVRLPSLLCLS